MKPYEIKASPRPGVLTAHPSSDRLRGSLRSGDMRKPARNDETAVARAVVGMGMFVAAAITVGLIVAIATLLGGCALERADPAARSARATYGAISMVASGDGATCSLTMGDGALTTADGEVAVTQPSTFTTTQNPDLSGAAGPVAAGIAAAAKVGGKAIDAYAARQEANAKAKTAPTATAAADCEDCGIEDADCEDCELSE